jgi:hypothetical protein
MQTTSPPHDPTRTEGRRRRRVVACAVTAVLALTVASCGGDGDEGGQTTGSAAPIAAAVGTAPADAGRPLARYAGYTTTNYGEPSHWLCRPEANDICKTSLDTTVVKADGTLTTEPFKAAENPPIDCFYLYPTISRDAAPFSDWNASPEEEGWTAVNQAARLRSVCRLFAPVYRQMTLAGLSSRLNASTTPAGETVDPYADVLDAFRTYMAQDNGGRPFVLVGHSQGSSMLKRLVAEEIDGQPDVRAKLVSAVLAGWALGVPDGADVGLDFKNVPLCRKPDQTGCALAWSSYRTTSPPGPGAYFGKVRGGPGVAACVSPATLVGAGADVHAYFPANRTASILAKGTGSAADAWVDPSVGKVSTPFVSPPGLVTAECVSKDGSNYFAVTVHGNPADPRADDIGGDITPEWGLHLDDVNLVMGDLVALVTRQAAAMPRS